MASSIKDSVPAQYNNKTANQEIAALTEHRFIPVKSYGALSAHSWSRNSDRENVKIY